MRTDLKLGIILGIVVVVCAVVLLVTRRDESAAPVVVQDVVPSATDSAAADTGSGLDTEAVDTSDSSEDLDVEDLAEDVTAIDTSVLAESSATIEDSPVEAAVETGGVIMPSLNGSDPCIAVEADTMVEGLAVDGAAGLVPEPDPCEPRYYVVQEGDTLTRISQVYYYGSGSFANVIYQANRDVINDPDVLQVGWRLRIPWPHEVEDFE
ncbi:MAG: LysM peptidoglycan-binding domain-containing protein [Sedimentisphaerales bacterium]|nr:LysM peptidoglycan-binding domain-containing protein [Sedimentisphaerales bacterium]